MSFVIFRFVFKRPFVMILRNGRWMFHLDSFGDNDILQKAIPEIRKASRLLLA